MRRCCLSFHARSGTSTLQLRRRRAQELQQHKTILRFDYPKIGEHLVDAWWAKTTRLGEERKAPESLVVLLTAKLLQSFPSTEELHHNYHNQQKFQSPKATCAN